MSRILVVYSSIDGQTLKICMRLQQFLENENHQVELITFDNNLTAKLEQFDAIIMGASIRYGKHRSNVREFIQHNRLYLDSRPNAFFSVNLVARKRGKNTPETNPYLKHFFKQVSWQPKIAGVFAGRVDYPRYNFIDKNIIRLIMWLTKGPTHPQAVVEFTDWGQVEDFGQRFCNLL